MDRAERIGKGIAALIREYEVINDNQPTVFDAPPQPAVERRKNYREGIIKSVNAYLDEIDADVPPPSYCIQNNGDCSTCSLVNYGRDCRNNPIRRSDNA